MSSSPTAVVKRLYGEFYNQPDLAIARQVAPTIFRDPQQFVNEYVALRNAFPDMQFHYDTTIHQGKLIAVRWSARGTQTGALVLPLGDLMRPRVRIPATNRTVETMGISIFEVTDGLISRRLWASSDGLDMLYTLGVRFVPPKPSRRQP